MIRCGTENETHYANKMFCQTLICRLWVALENNNNVKAKHIFCKHFIASIFIIIIDKIAFCKTVTTRIIFDDEDDGTKYCNIQ